MDLQALGYDVDNPITCPQNPKSTETENTSTVVVQIQQMQEDQEGTWKRERELELDRTKGTEREKHKQRVCVVIVRDANDRKLKDTTPSFPERPEHLKNFFCALECTPGTRSVTDRKSHPVLNASPRSRAA